MNRIDHLAARASILGLAAAALVACPGPAGQPCTVTDNGDGTSKIACPDGTSVTVRSGAPGTNGSNGTNGGNGTNGSNGTSCSVSANPDAGTKTITCTDGTSVTVLDGTNGVDANAVVDFATLTAAELAVTDMTATVASVTNAAKPVVTFAVRDAKGRGIKNLPPASFSGIAVLQLVPGTAAPTSVGNGLGLDTWVSHIARCATCQRTTESATGTGAALVGTLVDLGTGTYTYTFKTDVINGIPFDGGAATVPVAFDANAPHRFGMRIAAAAPLPTNAFRPVDAVYDYIPATGANILGQNDKVNTNNCLECHMQWRANAQNAGGAMKFHGGQRYDTRYCPVCHNDSLKYLSGNPPSNPIIAEPTIDALGNLTPPAGQTSVSFVRGESVLTLPVWIHKIHMGENLSLIGNYAGLGTDLNAITFPQNLGNCTKCHRNAALADNWKTRPSRRACGACHDSVDFTTGDGHGPANAGGPQADDHLCATCHVTAPDAGTPAIADIVLKHIPVEPMDPNNALLTIGGNSNTNASALGNPKNPPAGAKVFSYAMPAGAVTAVPTGDGGVNAQVKFKLMEGAADVTFTVLDAGVTELLPGFVGSPSVFCAFAVPQDGIAAPADFNASVSGYLKKLWDGTAAGTGAGTLSGPDSSGYYTATLTGVTIPPAAVMLTCGLGYTYSVAATQPLTQTNLAAYPAVSYDGGALFGGISIPPANVWQVAVGYTGRRGMTSSASLTGQIVDAAKCNNCHNMLGVRPTFHAGQRNNSPTCAFCHTPNRTSSGWSAGSGSYIHAIHGASVRTVPFAWHAAAPGDGFFNVTFPGRPQMCEGCHNPGMYDFSNAWYTPDNLTSRLPQTVATGTFNGASPTAYTLAPQCPQPYGMPCIVADGVTSYGAGYSYNASTQVSTEAAGTTLFNSQIANSCFGCHDAPRSVAHMRTNGGKLYEPRTSYPTTVEECLVCHGPGRVAAIKTMHYQ